MSIEIKTPGYYYQLPVQGGKVGEGYLLHFYQTARVGETDEVKTEHNGVHYRDVLAALHNHIAHLQTEFPPSPESMKVLHHLGQAILADMERTRDREQRGVKGKYGA